MAALLDGNLDRCAGTVPRKYLIDRHPEKIPVAFRQALVLYVRLTTHPILSYQDEATEANYRDFISRRDSIRRQFPRDVKDAERAERNLMADDPYGTYWFYYFYECPDRKFGLWENPQIYNCARGRFVETPLFLAQTSRLFAKISRV